MMREFWAKAASRKFVAFVFTMAVLGVLAWFDKASADAWVIAGVFGAYVGAQGLVDTASARKSRERDDTRRREPA